MNHPPTPVAQERTLTELDHARLRRLLPREAAAARGPGLAELAATLHEAELVPSRAVSPDVVTMYSRVLLSEPGNGRRHQITLCYPADAEPAEGFVSVLSPVGASLLGLRVGALARWHTPGGGLVQAELLALLFQPEASGDYLL
jgi:regulator of nucleoside diphosphate kinase